MTKRRSRHAIDGISQRDKRPLRSSPPRPACSMGARAQAEATGEARHDHCRCSTSIPPPTRADSRNWLSIRIPHVRSFSSATSFLGRRVVRDDFVVSGPRFDRRACSVSRNRCTTRRAHAARHAAALERPFAHATPRFSCSTPFARASRVATVPAARPRARPTGRARPAHARAVAASAPVGVRALAVSPARAEPPRSVAARAVALIHRYPSRPRTPLRGPWDGSTQPFARSQKGRFISCCF
jgi:hypothetical protein